MSYRFGKRSMSHLDTCHTKLKVLAVDLIEHIDFSVLEGHRSRQTHEALPIGATQVDYEDSRHSKLPSEAIHMAPWPYPLFEDPDPEIVKKAYWEQVYFAGWVMLTAAKLDIKLRWGGDWNMNNSLQDNKFDDLCHWELVDEDTDESD